MNRPTVIYNYNKLLGLMVRVSPQAGGNEVDWEGGGGVSKNALGANDVMLLLEFIPTYQFDFSSTLYDEMKSVFIEAKLD